MIGVYFSPLHCPFAGCRSQFIKRGKRSKSYRILG
jgi:hypothetical protein